MGFRRPILTAIAIVLVGTVSPACAQQNKPVISVATDTIAHRTFFSASLQREMPYEVVLPAGYESGQQRYPVLYLLHGWQGDETNWVKLTQLTKLAAAYPLIIVTPRAENSWYVNSATNPPDRYADYIVDDVIQDVDAHYRTIPDQRHRAVAGLSMGGYGALLLTMRHPGLFGFTGSISGAFSGPSGIEEVMPQLKPSTDQAFGTWGSTTRKENDLDSLISAADPAKTPYLFVECGAADPLLPANRHVVAELSSDKFAYEYHELPGAHTWSFWDNSLPSLLGVLAQQFHLGPAATAASTAASLHR